MALIYRPVYEDTYYTTTASTLEYQIFRGADLVFSGRAVRMPSQDSIRINVNKVCQDYLWQNIEFPLSTTQTHTNAAATFYLKNAAGTTLQDYRFIDCYDYDFHWHKFSKNEKPFVTAGNNAAYISQIGLIITSYHFDIKFKERGVRNVK